MRNRGKRWMAMALAVIVTCVNLFISGGNGLEVYADSETSEEFVIDENGVLTRYNGPGGDVVIPDGVTGIGEEAFSGCSSLASITIPASVMSIGGMEDNGFSGCSGLTTIIVDEKNTRYDSRGNCNAIIETETNALIVGCKNTIIPGSVTEIWHNAFSGCSGLTSITIPEGVTNIGMDAFSGCSGLTSVIIPEGVMGIEGDAFYGCSRLTSIVVDEKNTYYDSRENCNAIIKTNTNTLIVGCKNTIIPESVTSIGMEAFSGCSGLTSITIPEGITDIREYAFADCSGLTSIIVDKKNTCYDSRENCNAIIKTNTNTLIVGCKNTIIPESVTSIGMEAFSGCSGLTSITIPEGITNIGEIAFANCSGLTSIIIPEGVTRIENFTFSGCSGLTSVTIPTSVKYIGWGAFSGCSKLTNVIIPKEVTSIEWVAFDIETTLIVEEGSYAERYAKTNGYKYRTAFVCDASENPVLAKEAVNTLIEKNANNDIQILSNNNVQFTFAKGTMKAVEGLENYDFGTTVTTEFAEAGLPDSVTEEDFVAKISYHYSGQLPGEASIKIFVGKDYAGKRMEYSLIKDDNTLGESQSATVDSEGYITVKQSHCSAYVITLAKAMMGDTNNDGSITAEDALAILKHVVGLDILTGDALTSADVNADNSITAEDALDVLKKVVGLIDHFKAEETN